MDTCNNILSKKRSIAIQIMYIVAIILWILILYALEVYKHHSIFGYVILSVPIFVFALGYLSVTKLNKETKTYMFRGDVVTVALLFITAILSNIGKDNHYTIKIMLVATVLVLLSLIDIWSSPKTLELVQVIKSITQTIALTMLIYVLYIRFDTKLHLLR